MIISTDIPSEVFLYQCKQLTHFYSFIVFICYGIWRTISLVSYMSAYWILFSDVHIEQCYSYIDMAYMSAYDILFSNSLYLYFISIRTKQIVLTEGNNQLWSRIIYFLINYIDFDNYLHNLLLILLLRLSTWITRWRWPGILWAPSM